MAVYLNSGMVLLNGGMVATDAGCCCGGGGCAICQADSCCCWFSTPFEDGHGGFWTHAENDCFGVTTYSGATTFDAKYRIRTQTRNCCPPESGSSTCTEGGRCDEFDMCESFEEGDCEDPVICTAAVTDDLTELVVGIPCF